MGEWFSSHYQEFLSDFNQSFIEDDRWQYIVKGLGVTITVAIGALILGVIIGVMVAVIRSAHDQRRHKKSKGLVAYFLCIKAHLFLSPTYFYILKAYKYKTSAYNHNNHNKTKIHGYESGFNAFHAKNTILPIFSRLNRRNNSLRRVL